MPSRNIKLLISYEGTRYHGWQIQRDLITIQQFVERAIEQATGEKSRLANAGRTDSGVHAIGQVANFSTNSTIPAVKFRPALQRFLPDDITICESCEVPEDFHAGFDAKWKLYRYIILNSPIPNAQLSRFTTRISAPLNAERMNRAAQYLVGEHDFRSFESHYPNKATSVRNVMHCAVHPGEAWSHWQPDLNCLPLHAKTTTILYLDIVANGFLYNMVRSIAGTLIKIGKGDWEIEEAGSILKKLDRTKAGSTAPANGLYLMHVEYEKEFEEVGMKSFD